MPSIDQLVFPQVATGAQPYELTAAPTVWPIDLALVKSWAKIDTDADDALIDMLIQAITLSAEKYTKRDFIIKEYITYRDTFGDAGERPSYACFPALQIGPLNVPITLRRSKLQAVAEIKYWQDGSELVLDLANTQLVAKDAFGALAPVDDFQWPETDTRQQAISIRFTAGYGAAAASVPADLRQALLVHVTAAYSNRGDCDMAKACECAYAPSAALSVYNQYRIVDFVV